MFRDDFVACLLVYSLARSLAQDLAMHPASKAKPGTLEYDLAGGSKNGRLTREMFE